ncbi:MAG: hypothetical protein H7A25_09890 [Leptospiraceae bacterium]|nr:hypothetical protein [Leptospiraceae bacterium]
MINNFQDKTDNEIAKMWIEYSSDTKKNKELFNYWEYVNNLINNDSNKSWQLILTLIKYSNSDQILANIAAGPLEDFINKYYKDFYSKIDNQLRIDSKFRKCITGVWLNKNLSKDFRNMINKYTKTLKDSL